MLWALIQQFQIDQTKRDIADTQRANWRTWASNYEVKEQISKLSLVTQAAWTLLK